PVAEPGRAVGEVTDQLDPATRLRGEDVVGADRCPVGVVRGRGRAHGGQCYRGAPRAPPPVSQRRRTEAVMAPPPNMKVVPASANSMRIPDPVAANPGAGALAGAGDAATAGRALTGAAAARG